MPDPLGDFAPADGCRAPSQGTQIDLFGAPPTASGQTHTAAHNGGSARVTAWPSGYPL
jgi:hypothetical protein